MTEDEKVREIEEAIRKGYYGEYITEIKYLLSHISILKKELEDALHLRDIHRESAQYFEKRLRELRGGIEKLEEKSQNITDESDSWGCVHYESLMELYKLIEGD